jgi:cell division control protein 45
MYKLACRLYKRDLQYLWLAILGLTYQHIHYQIDDKQYAEELKYLKGELECEEEFLMADLPLSDNRLVFSEEYVNDVLLIFKEEIYYSTTLKRVSLTLNRYKLFMVRHWSIYESIYYSPYFASRFGVLNLCIRSHLLQRLSETMVKRD